jgi:3D (Asp-Asp-Asp) domain-containing protein
MNFNLGGLIDQAGIIVSKLDENVSLQDIINTLKLPDFGSLLKNVAGALPQNLVEIASDGALKLLNGTKLDQVLSSTIDNLQNEVLSEAQKALNSLNDVVSQASSVVNSVSDSINSISTAVAKNQSGFYNTALSLQNTVNNVQSNVNTTSSLDSIIKNTVDSVVDGLSPADVKKLNNNSSFYNTTLNNTICSVNVKLEEKLINQAEEYVSGSGSVQALNSLNLFAKEKLNNFTVDAEGYYEVDVIMSTFTDKGSTATLESISNSSKSSTAKTASGRKHSTGRTCSVDNNKILLKSTVIVPDVGTFYAADIIKNSSNELSLYYGTDGDANTIAANIINPTKVKVKPPTSNITTGSNLGSGSGGSTPTQITTTIRGNFQKLV